MFPKKTSRPLDPSEKINISYTNTDRKHDTFVRHILVETILLLENMVMILYARKIVAINSHFDDVYSGTLICVIVSYFTAMFLKILFYLHY
mgnify:CR=1 FL=1